MASNVLYVQTDGDDKKAEMGNPLTPFTLAGALHYLNNLENGSQIFIQIGSGTYNLESPNIAVITSDVVITGTGSKSTIINAFQFRITNSSMVTIQSLTIKANKSKYLFHLQTGILNLYNSEVQINTGAAFSNEDGSLVINGSVFYLTNTDYAPIINLTKTAAIITNSNFYFRLNTPINKNLPLIGTLPRQGSIALNNVGIGIELNGGIGLVVPFYNIASINSAVVQVKGSNSEGLILYGTDSSPTLESDNLIPVSPYYLNNIIVTIHHLNRIYSLYNPNSYPVMSNNINWNGITQKPSTYSRQSNPALGSSLPTGSEGVNSEDSSIPNLAPESTFSPKEINVENDFNSNFNDLEGV